MATDDSYVCTLEPKFVKKAKDELNENPQDRLAAVQALREWIIEQPHIQCPPDKLDTEMLLMFLRGSKFSQIKAREKFETSLLMKVDYPQWFLDVDVFHPSVKTQLDAGIYLPLPKRTPDGCLVILYRMALYRKLLEPVKMPFDETIRFGAISMDLLQSPEMNQVNGLIFILDMSDVSLGLLKKLYNPETSKVEKAFLKSMVGRFKGFHYYRAGVLMETILAFYRPFMPKKWMERIKLHDTMASLYKAVPKDCLPVEFLPDDYTGPHVGTMEEIKNNFAKELLTQEYRDDLLYRTSKAFWIDKNQQPKEKNTQHFRKLNVD